MKDLEQLTVFYGILQNPLVSAFAEAVKQPQNERAQTEFFRKLYAADAQEDFCAYFCNAVLRDENAFARACAEENPLSRYLFAAAVSDLQRIGQALKEWSADDRFNVGRASELFEGWNEKTAERLSAYYRKNGYGKFSEYTAFRYTEGELVPIQSPSRVSLRDLKGYEREKAEVLDNFENFARGLPFSDMLLYGDRGTGKSSTVHAAVNLYAAQKVRLVELAKEDLLCLPSLKTKLAQIPMKFVLFVDDFSLSEKDERFSTLKAALQGSMEGHAKNVMIAATSNRRHIVEENFDTRRNSVHEVDSEQELLSLSDRFGITVLFSSVGKAEYLAIVSALADDAELTTEKETLFRLAETWALIKGGRSPRRAKQFIDYASACERKHKKIQL